MTFLNMPDKIQIGVGFTYGADKKVAIYCKDVPGLEIENITMLQAIVYFNGITSTYDVKFLDDGYATYLQICGDAYRSIQG